jgi:hypothetical protein
MSAAVAAAPSPVDWHTANQRYLMAALGVLRAGLEARVAAGPQGPAPDGGGALPEPGAGGQAAAAQRLEAAAAVLPSPSALERITVLFGLSSFERDVLLLAAGPELDGGFSALLGTLPGAARAGQPTFGLALGALQDAHWSALTSQAPLRRYHLVEVGPGDSLIGSPLRVDEPVLHHLCGVPVRDTRLQGIVDPAFSELGPTTPTQQRLAARVGELWRRASAHRRPPLLALCGPPNAGLTEVAAAVALGLGLGLAVLPAAAIPTLPAELDLFVHLWARESVLEGRALCVDLVEPRGLDPAREAAVDQLLERLGGLVMVVARERRPLQRRACLTFDVPGPTSEERRTLWERALAAPGGPPAGPAPLPVGGAAALVDDLTSQFRLSARSLEGACVEAAQAATDAGGAEAAAMRLWDACRAQARPRLDDLAQRLEGLATWDDLVLPDSLRRILRDVATHVRQRATVYERWGFSTRGSRGLGVSALFSGGSGTGKTTAAEVLARELRLDLYRIDLSSVVSKYIGETEKNLRRLFDAADEGGAILLFDEADALFGKRSEVKDSHDRYANIEVSYLLQRMESYRGLAILTTNLKGAIDAAFLRRLRFVVPFPFPDAAQRAEIWRRVFPANTPTEGLDPRRLAQLAVAGGSIRNIALGAAFMAAESGEPVRPGHVVRAARAEYAKLEKPLTDAETAGLT